MQGGSLHPRALLPVFARYVFHSLNISRSTSRLYIVTLLLTLESLLNCKEINQYILKEMSLEYSLEGLMLKLKLQYFGHLIEELTHLKRS